MDFGIGIATSHDSWKLAQRAEELGFTHAWFYDTQMITADCFVAMGAAAMKTSRIRLGTGVLVPSNRIAAVTANSFATLNGMAPGRIDFGVGTGFSARRAMGQQLLDVAAMRLVRRHVEAELHGADDAAIEPGGEQHRLVARHGRDHLLEEFRSVIVAERQHEADARAAFDAIDKHIGEFLDRSMRGRRIEEQNLGLCVHVPNMPVRAQRYRPGA